MSNRWNILIESIPDYDNSRNSQPNEGQKVMSIPNRSFYGDNQPSGTIYPVQNRPVLQSFNQSPSPNSYRQTPDPPDTRPVKIIRYVSLSKIPSTDDKSSQTLTDQELERQHSMVVQSSYAPNTSESNNYFSDSRNLRRYRSANSFSPPEWREPIKPTTIVSRQSSFSSASPAWKDREIVPVNAKDDSMNKNTDSYEPEVCIKKKLSHGANHYIYITHGRNSP
ncbi:unnamed protein product [Schistosoma spindalis]|nr:unnamed protein product [Schistosoma spindale]